MSNWNGTAYHLDATDVEMCMRSLMTSKFISSRKEYLGRLLLETNIAVSESTVINACAGRIPDELVKTQIPSDEGQAAHFIPKRYQIIINEGILNWLSALACVVAVLDKTGSTRRAKEMLKWMKNSQIDGEVGTDFLLRLQDKFKLKSDSVMVELCSMYARSMLYSVIAHECGHICLGHLGSVGYLENNSISRNDERQADTFMSSAVQSTCMGAQGAIGAIFTFIGFKYIGTKKGNGNLFSTHPISDYRIEMLLQDFAAMLMVSHISKNQIKALV